MTLSKILIQKQKKIILLLENKEKKHEIYEMFKDISNFIYGRYIPKTRFLLQKKNNKKLELQIKELKSEITKYKQTLKILKIIK
jgi:hypothetical protein